jgi:hypothetical protein
VTQRVVDNDALDPFVDRPGAYKAAQAAIERGDLEVFYVHTTLEEAAADRRPGAESTAAPGPHDRGKLVLSSGILIDISRFDHARFTDDAGAATSMRWSVRTSPRMAGMPSQRRRP